MLKQNMQKAPKTLIEAIQYFSDAKVCVEFVKNLVFPEGQVVCRKCGCTDVTELSTRQLWQCKGCRKQFSVKVGTIFEDSPISLSKWLCAVWLITNAKNGISSYEIHRAIGVTQKTAWFLLHRIRHAMAEGSFVKLAGQVEVDEMYVGGKSKNKHAWQRTGISGGADKTAVMGAVERGGRVTAKVITTQKVRAMGNEVRGMVEQGSQLFTDELTAYSYLAKEYQHGVVNHGKGEYVKGEAHTNTIEGFWALFKRTLTGTYTHVEPFHLDAYLNEQSLRYNLRKGTDLSRFIHVLSQISGRRLTWEQLTA